ncbi:MAG: tetratricopeptide repeat protein [Pseudobdellovibrionaceae bacterium]
MLYAYNQFNSYFNSDAIFKDEIAALKSQVENEKLKNTLISYQTLDFQQNVAVLLPQSAKVIAKNDWSKTFSQVLRAPASINAIDTSEILFQRGKSAFAEKDYASATKLFIKLNEDYPLSPYKVHAYFYIVEMSFLKKEYKKATTDIEFMVDLFPEHELSGWALMRLGEISEKNYQYQEAAVIYGLVKDNFSSIPFLYKQANFRLNNMKVK